MVLLGVWNWKSPDVIAALDQFHSKAEPFTSHLIPTGAVNPACTGVSNGLIAVLRQRGAIVLSWILPEPTPGIKVGIDEYFAASANRKVTTLLRHAIEAGELIDDTDDDIETGSYAVETGILPKRERDGDVLSHSATSGQIIEEVIADDGLDERGH